MCLVGSVTPRSQSANKHLPLSCAAARRAGLGELRHTVSTGSTNDDLAQEARLVGLGLNVAEAPGVPGAVSLAQAGSAVTRDELLARMIDELPGHLADPSRARAHLRDASATIGRTVRVQRADGASVVGTAVDIDAAGGLILAGDCGEVRIDTGDVFHLRS